VILTEYVLARPAIHRVPPTTPFRPPIPPTNSTISRLEKYSSLAYRKQAAELMEQIKSDMKGSKRIFSGDTELRDGDKENEQLGPRDRKAPNRAPFLTPAPPRASRHIPTYTQRSNTKVIVLGNFRASQAWPMNSIGSWPMGLLI